MQTNVLEYLERGALATRGNETAIVDGESRVTFAELEVRAKRCASLIIQKRDVLNKPIAVLLPKNAPTIIADLGILYSGNCYTNLDIKSPLQRLKNILGNIQPALLITSTALAELVRTLEIGELPVVTMEEMMASNAPCSDDALLARRNAVIDTDPLCIINTSGSTGIPKGVVLNHRSTIDFMDWVIATLQLGPEGVIGSLSPFYFDIYTLELYYCLATGARLVIIPDQLAIFPAKLVQYLAEQAISFIFWVPTIMVNISNQNLLATVDLGCLKKVFFAGEVFPTKHFNYWRKRLPQATFVNLYGPIEITVDCTYYVVEREFRDDEPLPIGFPCRNTDVLILTDKNQPAAVDEPGELCVRGSSLAMGYWNDPEKTGAAFVQNPLNKHYPELIYRTGDLVYRNKRGEIMFIGRKDFQIKHFGYRIELSEIEHCVVSIQQIDNACVLYNHEKKEIVLFYEAKQAVSPAFIREGLLKILPKYMLPSVFHQLEAMPRNPNGKIDRQALVHRLGKAGQAG